MMPGAHFMMNDNPPPGRHRGVALAVALILLAVIGLGSVTALRSGMFGSLIAGNLRSNQLAVQAAEMALRYCERLAMTDPPGITVQALPATNTDRPDLWRVKANWSGPTALAFDLPDAVVNSPKSAIRYAQAPQCLVERMELRRGRGAFDEVAFQVTGRGFSPNFSVDGDGAINGSEVWLQSTLRFTR